VPAEKLFHVDGTPREAFVPCHIDAAGDQSADVELDAAVKLAKALATTKGQNAPRWKCGS
jgi:hypothetical protein